LTQTAPYADILTALGIVDKTRDLRVIFLHLDGARFEIVPLNRTDPASPESPVTLHTFERLFCTDEMAVAVVDWPGSAETLNLKDHLVSHCRKIAYPADAFRQGLPPLWGGGV